MQTTIILESFCRMVIHCWWLDKTFHEASGRPEIPCKLARIAGTLLTHCWFAHIYRWEKPLDVEPTRQNTAMHERDYIRLFIIVETFNLVFIPNSWTYRRFPEDYFLITLLAHILVAEQYRRSGKSPRDPTPNIRAYFSKTEFNQYSTLVL